MVFRKRTKKRRDRRATLKDRSLRFEPLESRRLLAGDVAASVVGSTLVIRGDVDDNQLTIEADALIPGRVTITPDGSTTLNGVAVPQVFQATADIRMRMGNGDDQVIFAGQGGTLARDLHFDGGQGDNVFDLSDYAVGRKVEVRNGNGDDIVNIAAIDALLVNINNRHGDNTTSLSGAFAALPASETIVRDLRITNGNGDQTVTIDNETIGRDVAIRNGDGNHVIDLFAVQIGDDLVISNGDGDVTTSTTLVDIGDDLILRNKDGFNSLAVTSSQLGDDLNVRNGDGGGSTVVDNSQIADHVSIRNGEAQDTTLVDSMVGASIYIREGNGTGSLVVSLSQVGVDLNLLTRTGDHNVDISESAIGDDLTVRTGNGAHTVTIDDSGIVDNVSLTLGHGGSTVNLGSDGAPLDVGGYVHVRNGNGDNNVTVDDATIGDDLIVRNGNGTNTTQVGVIAPVSIGSDALLLNGDDGATVVVNAVDIVGYLRVRTGRGDDTVVLSGTAVGDLIVGTRTTVDTSRGADTASVGVDVAGVTDISGGPLRLKLGGDSDTATIGEGTVVDVLASDIDGGASGGDVLTVTAGTAFDPFDPANRLRLRAWELIVI